MLSGNPFEPYFSNRASVFSFSAYSIWNGCQLKSRITYTVLPGSWDRQVGHVLPYEMELVFCFLKRSVQLFVMRGHLYSGNATIFYYYTN